LVKGFLIDAQLPPLLKKLFQDSGKIISEIDEQDLIILEKKHA